MAYRFRKLLNLIPHFSFRYCWKFTCGTCARIASQ